MNTTTLIILGILLLLLIIFTLYKVSSNIGVLRLRCQSQINRVEKLQLRNMLDHLRIPFRQYLNKTSDLDKERHIWTCRSCPHPQECKQLLDGDAVDMDIEEMCPNHNRLKHLSKPAAH
jgi:type III secretory pathway component EscR